jgi:ABC-type polysaccharide/polyol phosphate export permease
MNCFLIGMEILIIIIALLAIVYSFGVVWRVEKKLDVAYKLLLASIISFALSEIFSVLQIGNPDLMKILGLVLKLAFIILFLLSILEARKMIRQMDKEIPGKIGEE